MLGPKCPGKVGDWLESESESISGRSGLNAGLLSTGLCSNLSGVISSSMPETSSEINDLMTLGIFYYSSIILNKLVKCE